MALPATLSKQERLCSKKLIDALFNGSNSRAMSAFPLRAVYMPLATPASPETPASLATPETPAFSASPASPASSSQMLISVPKRYFKRAVKRNRVKRQVREAYRHNKHIISDEQLAIAFIWLSDKLYATPEVEDRVRNLLTRIKEKMRHGPRD